MVKETSNKQAQQDTTQANPQDEKFMRIFKKICFIFGAFVIIWVLVIVGKSAARNIQKVQEKMARERITEEAKAHCRKRGYDITSFGNVAKRCEVCREYDEYFLDKYCEERTPTFFLSLVSSNCSQFKKEVFPPNCFSEEWLH